MKKALLVFMAMLMLQVYGQKVNPTPCGPVPTDNQLRWQEMEYASRQA